MRETIDIEKWATAYISIHEARASLNEAHPDFLAAYHFMDELAGPVAEECWQGILAVVHKKPSDWVLGMLAAGPVEDLLQQSGAQFIDRIETEARRDPTSRSMLSGVWQSGSPDVWARLEAARGDAGHAA